MLSRLVRPLVSSRRHAVNLVLDRSADMRKAEAPSYREVPGAVRNEVIAAKTIQAAQLLLDIEALVEQGR